MPIVGIALLLWVAAEIAVLIVVGRAAGILGTLFLLFGIGFAGLAVVRMQGLRAMAEAQAALSRGDVPVGPAADAAALILAGVLLAIPGFLTDLVAIPLLIPALRRHLFRPLFVIAAHQRSGKMRRRATPEIVDADYVEVADEPTKGNALPPRSRWGRPPSPPDDGPPTRG
jgi:UPF0716 protein FxsA